MVILNLVHIFKLNHLLVIRMPIQSIIMQLIIIRIKSPVLWVKKVHQVMVIILYHIPRFCWHLVKIHYYILSKWGFTFNSVSKNTFFTIESIFWRGEVRCVNVVPLFGNLGHMCQCGVSMTLILQVLVEKFTFKTNFSKKFEISR